MNRCLISLGIALTSPYRYTGILMVFPSTRSLQRSKMTHWSATPPPPSRAGTDNKQNWNRALKLGVTLQVSFLALLGPLGAAAPNPAFVVMSEYFDMSVTEISYGIYPLPDWINPIATHQLTMQS